MSEKPEPPKRKYTPKKKENLNKWLDIKEDDPVTAEEFRDFTKHVTIRLDGLLAYIERLHDIALQVEADECLDQSESKE